MNPVVLAIRRVGEGVVVAAGVAGSELGHAASVLLGARLAAGILAGVLSVGDPIVDLGADHVGSVN